MRITVLKHKTWRIPKIFQKEWDKLDIEHFGREIKDKKPKEFVIKAQIGKEVAGFAKVRLFLGVGKIREIIVKEKFRGRGVGKALLEKAEEIFRENKAHKMVLETGKHWKARKFYEKLGFKVSAILKAHYGGVDFVVMEKALD